MWHHHGQSAAPIPNPHSLIPLGYRVGYATETFTEDGSKAIAPQFVAIGQNGIKLTDITFDIGETAKVSGELNIQLLNKNGFMDKSYSYYKGQGSRTKHPVDGWYDEDTGLIISEENENIPFFEKGTGLWVSGLESFKMTVSGEVVKTPLATTFDEDGSKLIANPFPVAVKLTDMVFDIGETAKVSGELNIQLLNKNGFMDKSYSYYKGQGSRTKHPVDGWYDEDTGLIISEENENIPVFTAGVALWVSALEGWSVTIPAPKL